MSRFRWLVFEQVAMCGLIGMSIAMYDAFLAAYRNPSKQVIIDINHYGEAQWELIVFPVFIIMGIIAAVRICYNRKWS